MPVSVRVLFDRPQHEIASLLTDKLARCKSASLVAGFMTAAGIEAIEAPIHGAPGKLKALVVGAGTYQAFQALDSLLAARVPPDRLHIHLGFSGPSGGIKNPFHRYRPMLHSKVYLMDMPDGSSAAFVGSHNLTGFALLGANGEAGVLIEGPADASEFAQLRQHIAACVAQATEYQPAMKDAYAWWTAQFIEGLKLEVGHEPSDDEKKHTIVVLSAQGSGALPKANSVIYFEMPRSLMDFKSLQPEVHVYVFDQLPSSPVSALSSLSSAKARFVCEFESILKQRGGLELVADFYIDNRKQPELKAAPRPFRPRPALGMQQLAVRVQSSIKAKFEYLFDRGTVKWEPIYGETTETVPGEDNWAVALPEKLLPRLSKQWLRVTELRRTAVDGKDAKQLALWEADPESGSFIVFSWRRRREA